SVERATLMAGVYFAGRTVDLRGPQHNSLALVAALLVATDPRTGADPAFILTCGATAGILVALPLVPLQHLPTPVRAAATMLAASLAVEAALLPVGAVIFSRITFAGLVLNFAAIPLMGVAQIAGMAVVPLAATSSRAAAAAGWVAHMGA